MQTNITNTYLKLIPFEKLNYWSVAFLLDREDQYNNNFQRIRIGAFLTRSRETIEIKNDEYYSRITVRMNSNGVILRDKERGENIGTKNQFRARKGQFILSKIDARNGAFGIIPDELDGAIVTNDFPIFNINAEQVNPLFFFLLTKTNAFVLFAKSCSSGTTNRQRMDINQFLNLEIPLPSLKEQEQIVHVYYNKTQQAEQLELQAKYLEEEIERHLFDALGIEFTRSEVKQGLQIINFKDIYEWGIDKLISKSGFSSARFETQPVGGVLNLVQEVFRGKSPRYNNNSSKFILNQKCNRWNFLDLTYVKSVDEMWYHSIDKNFFTKYGDILINSTGEGTIGRASFINENFENLLYDSHILLLRLNNKIIDPELFVELFNSSFGQSQVEEIKSAQATKQTELGINNLLKIKIPIIPDLKNQKGIINEIKALRSNIKLKAEQAATLNQQARQAFEETIFN